MINNITLFSFCLISIFAINCFSEIKSFFKEYTYQASEADSKVSCRATALEQTKKLLLQELDTYIVNEIVLVNDELVKNSITALTCGVVQVVILEERWDGVLYYLKAKIDADPNKVIEDVKRLRNDNNKAKEIQDLNNIIDNILYENNKLKNEISKASNNDKAALQGRYDSNIAILRANELVQNGRDNRSFRNIFINNTNSSKEIDLFTQAISIYPNCGEAFFERGLSYYQSYKPDLLDSAISDFTKTIQLNRSLYQAYLLRGNCYFILSKNEKAISDYSNCISYNPSCYQAYCQRFIIFKSNNLFDLAKQDSATVMKHFTLDTSSTIEYWPLALDSFMALESIKKEYANLVLKGNIYYDLGNFSLAVDAFSQAISLCSYEEWGYSRRLVTYKKLGLIKQARTDSITIQRRIRSGALLGATYKLNLQNPKEANKAISLCNKAIRNEPTFAGGYSRKAEVLFALKKYPLAIQNCDTAIALDSTDCFSYVTRGDSHSELKEYLGAIKDYSKALELSPVTNFYTARGWAYAMLGHTSQAIEDFNKAIEIDPNYGESYYYRGLYTIKYNKQKAISDLKIAAKIGVVAAKDMLINLGEIW